jgi:hypothetical protein|tara:strand:+ start:2167 stop:2550 length:384 start_codon:yes stop_codon:yes gene_type:complete
MKILIFLILVFNINLKTFSQDTVKIPQEELENFFLALDTLQYQDSIKTILIKDFESQIINYKILTKQDSLLLLFKKQETELLNQQINLHLDRLKVIDRWYHKPWVGFVGGISSTLLIIHIIDYSLPQ